MVDFINIPLKEIADITMGQSPKSEFYNDKKEGMPFLQGNNTFGDKFPTFEKYTTQIKKIANKDDVLMSVRAPVGDLNIANTDICIGRGLCALKMKSGNNLFLYYLLKNNISQLIKQQSGTVFGSINKKDIENFEVRIPESIEIQDKITLFLSNIDDLIFHLLNINQNLSNQLDIIFRAFFITFDFVDKNEFKDSKLGKIPKSFVIKSLGEVTEKIDEKVGENNFKVLSAVNSGKLKLSEEFFNKQVFSKDIHNYFIVHENEFAYNPARINIGSIGMNELDFTGCVSPAYVAFKSEINYEPFMNLFIKTSRFNNEVNVRASGSVRQILNYKDFSLIELPYPDKYTINKFNKYYFMYIKKIKHNKKEIEKLTQLRDTLLPKLMSGEIDVSKVQV